MFTEKIKNTLKSAAKKLTGVAKRAFLAQVAIDYFKGSSRKAERQMGWSRNTVEKGLKELEIGIVCVDNYKTRGRKKVEQKLVNLEEDIRSLIEGDSQTDATFQTTLRYSRISAKKVREALIEQKGYLDSQLPTRQTIGDVLNRLNYRLRKPLKNKPLKKIPQTDAIFDNVHKANQTSDENPNSLRISIDCKAKVKIGNLSRGGAARTQKAKQADAHDTKIKAKLVPFGLREMGEDNLTIFMGQSYETSDFIVDCLELWWDENKKRFSHINELVINSDNGPSVESHRTQFIKRMVEFGQQAGLSIKLIYYPPYHSQYNPIERCWGALENYWNGAILDTIDSAINWAVNMSFKGKNPDVYLVEGTYKKSVVVGKKELKSFKPFWKRSEELPKWDVTILPVSA